MLRKIKIYFEQFISIKTSSPEDTQHALNLAVAAIMIEMVGIDNQIDSAELNQLNGVLMQQLNLKESEVLELNQLAQQELSNSTDYHQFTSLINAHFEPAQKRDIIESLWKIAFSDGKIDSHEEHFLRKIADLLFIPHSEFIQAKLKLISG